MTEKDDIKTTDSGMLSSKFARVLLTIVSVFLVFAGPTYVVYGLFVALKVSLDVSLVTGFILFIVGMVMMRYLVRKKIIS